MGRDEGMKRMKMTRHGDARTRLRLLKFRLGVLQRGCKEVGVGMVLVMVMVMVMFVFVNVRGVALQLQCE